MKHKIEPYANLRGADLRGAKLMGAKLMGAKLMGANLSYANLSYADLRSADLRGTDLRDADLLGANLTGAWLAGADLTGVTLPNFQIPQTDTLEVFKKCRYKVVVKLKIPARAKRTASLVGRKCRAEYAKVLKVYGEEAVSMHDPGVIYEEGAIVRPDSYCDDIGGS